MTLPLVIDRSWGVGRMTADGTPPPSPCMGRELRKVFPELTGFGAVTKGDN